MSSNFRKKILSMFILGYEEEMPSDEFLKLIDEGLGGVIFFTRNIKTTEQFKSAVEKIKAHENPKQPLFLSIDQEGGRVERTLNIYNGSHYLGAKDSCEKGIAFVEEQTKKIASELRSFGLNMNFAPVLDVNTNPCNPIIGNRSYSQNPDEVIKFASIAAKTYLENSIIPVGKHFPGHGDTAVDSHKAMPVVSLEIDELENIHIKPFKSLIKNNLLSAIMVAHVHYKAFEENPIPASISKNVIQNYLRNKLNFNGIVISDDMVMGGIKGFSSFEACKLGIDAGINMFIFRDANKETLELIDKLTLETEKGNIDISKINESIEKINALKSQRLTNV